MFRSRIFDVLVFNRYSSIIEAKMERCMRSQEQDFKYLFIVIDIVYMLSYVVCCVLCFIYMAVCKMGVM